MLFAALIIGVVLIVAAIRNSQAALFSALATDVPEYVIWAAAIVAVGAIGYVPGLKPVSRGLLALVILVVILNNYKAILAGFESASVGAIKSGANNASSSSTNPVASTASDTSGLAASAQQATSFATSILAAGVS